MSELKLQSNGTIVFEAKGFSGGRNKCKDASGFVRMEIAPINEHHEVYVTILDNLSCDDGHYSPLELSIEQLKNLRAWLDKQLEA